MKKYIYSIVAATALFASCSQDAELNEIGNTDPKAITTIGASTEISTRAVVSSADNTKVLWQDGDQLGVLGTNGSSEAKNLAYALDGEGGSTTGTFKNESSDITAISAVMYPYQESATWADSKLTCEIPSVQTATKVGSFDKAAAIMYSIGSTTNVALNYAVNFLKVTISETETNVHAITISSTTTALSGKMEITSEGVSAATSGSQRYVTLTAGKGNVLAVGDYYIAVKAGDIENPTISYVYYNDDHTVTEKSKAGSRTLSFASGTNVKLISVDFNSGSVITRDAVQLWAEGPYFADRNVGANTATESGTSMTFTDVTETGADYVWGNNWCIPSKDQMDELVKAATTSDSEKVECEYTQENTVWGFKFTGSTDGYTSNSVFFPDPGGFSICGTAEYWSGTDSSGAWIMTLKYDDGDLVGALQWFNQDRLVQYDYSPHVRPVFKN